MTKAGSKRKMTLADACNAVARLEKENQDIRDNYDQFKATAEPEIEILKKENEKLKNRNAELKGMYAHSAREAGTYKQFFEQLKKENAELKAKNKWYSEQVCNKECAEVWGNLTKAKEVIKSSVVLLTKSRTALDTKTYLMKAEKFIKEIEK